MKLANLVARLRGLDLTKPLVLDRMPTDAECQRYNLTWGDDMLRQSRWDALRSALLMAVPPSPEAWRQPAPMELSVGRVVDGGEVVTPEYYAPVFCLSQAPEDKEEDP